MNLRKNYHHKLWNNIALSTTDYTTVATVTLVQYASVLVELVLEGAWAGAPSLYRGEYIITHNDGNTPEVRFNITLFYESTCANNGKGALNTPEVRDPRPGHHTPLEEGDPGGGCLQGTRGPPLGSWTEDLPPS